jgi:acetolactate synthase I/II/III large subunit
VSIPMTSRSAPATAPPSTRAPNGERPGAEVLVSCLAAAGVEVVFGVPGDTGVDLYAAFADQSEVRHVLARDERHAAKMADAYARSTNRIGVLEVSSGGGATFSVGGLGEAYAAGIPVLVLSSDIHSGSRGTRALTEIDQLQLFTAVTKWRRRITTADDIPQAVQEALHQAGSGRPGPVALVVPEDVLGAATTATALACDDTVPRDRRAADADAVTALVRALADARRPAIVAGSGVHQSAAWDALAEVAHAAACPVATTIHGKGAYPEDAAWSLGVAGSNGGRAEVNDYLARADVVLFVGTRANATDTDSFRSPPRSATTFVLDVDADLTTGATRNYPDSLPLVGDARTTLELVAQVLRPLPDPVRAQRADAVAGARRTGRGHGTTVTARAEPRPDGRLSAREAIRVAHDAMPDDALVVADCGTPTPVLAADVVSRRAGRRILVARGHGPMGYAIPASVGAAVAHPGKRVLCLTTDGSFTMACGELATAAALHLPITYVQLTNGSFGWIKMLQHLYYDRRYFGVDLHPVDSVAVAAAFGVPSHRVTSLTQLKDLVADRGPQDGPLYLDVVVPEQMDEVPTVSSWEAALAGDRRRPVY